MQAVFSFITMQLQLCSVFFTFSLGTRTHYFGRTILHGGAKVCIPFLSCEKFVFLFVLALYNSIYIVNCHQQYRATGRGFVVRHIKFAENYRLYSRSHFVKAWVIFGAKDKFCIYIYVYLGTWGLGFGVWLLFHLEDLTICFKTWVLNFFTGLKWLCS